MQAQKHAPLFLGLSAYSRVGGLQNFNARVVRNLVAIGKATNSGQPQALFLDDLDTDAPDCTRAYTRGFASRRARFIYSCLRSSLKSDILLIGHINLLPVAWIIKKLRPHLPTVLFVHGDEVWNGTARSKRAYEAYMLNSIDTIASVSDHTANIMSREFSIPKGRFTLFPNAVDPKPLRVSDTKAPHPIVLTVTRMGDGDRRKNVDQLIRAISILKSKGSPAHLQIVGSGSLVEELRNIAIEVEVEDRIEFLGRLDDASLNDAYDRASVFVLPSSKEGFGIVYLEAWLRQLPVICGRLGAAHEVVTHGVDGLVVDETSPADLSEAIQKILANPRLAENMGTAGFQKVKDKYLNDSAQKNLEKLLQGEAPPMEAPSGNPVR